MINLIGCLKIEKLVTQLSKSCGMLFKLKHYANISVLKSVYFALFHSYLTYSMLNSLIAGATIYSWLLSMLERRYGFRASARVGKALI